MMKKINNNSSSSLSSNNSASIKKNNKPLMEKKRRARINECLNQLKLLVLNAMKKEGNLYSKLEKADILELTVKHLRQQRRQQIYGSNEPIFNKYVAGYNECASEVQRFLSTVETIDIETRNRLFNHLFNSANTIVERKPVVEPHYQQPLHDINENLQKNIENNKPFKIVSGILPNGQLTTLLLPVNNHNSVNKQQQQSTSQNFSLDKENRTDDFVWRPW